MNANVDMNTFKSAVCVQNVSHRFGKTEALQDVSLEIPRGVTVGLIGPDGVGKSTLLSLIAGVRIIQQGSVEVLGGDMADARTRQALSHRLAFMPQGLGQNLYPTLSVYENIDFHARLFGLNPAKRKARIQRLLEATGLAPFPNRAAGKLSGGMKQKLSLCCALVHSPDLLILDEPTTGVDPLSRRQFWALVADLQAESAGMTVIVATAYIEEAEHFEYLLAMDDGQLLVNKPTCEVMLESDAETLEEAYVSLLPQEKQQGMGSLELTQFVPNPTLPPAIEAEGLTKRFGDFVAVDNVSFRIDQGEIFGFLGSNGCGKSTTMKMLTGLHEATEGTAQLLGRPIDASDMQTRMRVGYMSQAFSLYEELTVRQNLELHAQLYQMGRRAGKAAIAEALIQFDLTNVVDSYPPALPLGIRQRLQLAAACLHKPQVLILDEPTSGVDPAARDMFWRYLLKLSREEKITIFVSTHFMNEAKRCDRISFMHRGRVLAVGTPQELTEHQNTANLEEAFIQYLLTDEHEHSETNQDENTQQRLPEKNIANSAIQIISHADASHLSDISPNERLNQHAQQSVEQHTDTFKYWLAMIWTFARREGKELLRDKIRLFFAVLGPLILMSAVVWSVSFDVHDLRFSALDHDQTVESRRLVEYFSGSRYFLEQPPLYTESQISEVLQKSQASLVIEIPAGFGRDLLRLNKPEVGFYIDGTVPFNASNIQGYIGGILGLYSQDLLRNGGLAISLQPAAVVEPRFMYNQDFKSIFAVAPSVLMIMLMLIPSMMTAIAVVREREIGSISNFYTSPASVPQYLIGKQLPYIAVGLINYLALVLMMIFWFGVPLKGSFIALTIGTTLMICVSTSLGLLVSIFVRTQLAAIFVNQIITLIPTINFSGFLYPVSTLNGGAYLVAKLFPASWYLRISIGTFAKGLGVMDLLREYLALSAFFAFYLLVACLVLKKQEK